MDTVLDACVISCSKSNEILPPRPTKNRCYRLVRRPKGKVTEEDLTLCEEEIPPLEEGQVLAQNLVLSIDPTHRIWMSDRPQYMPCVDLGDVMRALSMAKIVESRHPDFAVGDVVSALGNVQEYFAGAPEQHMLTKLPDSSTRNVSVCSVVIGLTAWHGATKILQAGSDDVVVVSGAAGAVGSIASQLCKARGAKVIGIAGGPDKCKYLTDELGLDGAIDYIVDGPVVIGLTAWHGATKILQAGSDDVVVVSGAAGAVGSIASQLCKARGAKVIGIAGGPDKCKYLTDELGLDGAIDYKSDDVDAKLKELAPDGFTGYFDNVGGTVTEAVLNNMRNFSKMALCGSISEYNDKFVGITNFNMILMRRIQVQGFICMDHMDEYPECLAELTDLVKQGKLKYREHVDHGLENYVDVLNLLFEGKNTGKLMLRVAAD